MVYLVSNLISLLIPGDALEEEGLTLPGVPGDPHLQHRFFGVILSDSSQCFHTAAGALTL